MLFWLCYSRLKKSAEHRKRVLQKKQLIEEKRSAVLFSDIVADTTQGKSSTHHRIVDFVNRFGASAFIKAYNKQQLTKLCQAYGVVCNARSNKTTMATAVLPVIRASDRIPYPYYVEDLQANASADDEAQRVILRITRRPRQN